MSVPRSLGSSPLSPAPLDEAGGNPIFCATPRHADPLADLEPSDWDRAAGTVAIVAVTYRDDFAALAASLPLDSRGRARLDALLYAVDHAEALR